MKQSGRKSAESLFVVPVSGQRLPAPDHLTADQAAEWTSIVDSLPADYFRPGDVPLLAAFCTASALYKRASADVERRGMYCADERGKEYVNPAYQYLTSQASAMAQMAVKLRLCPSARYSEKSAATKAERAGGKRPWESTGTDE